MSLTKIFIFYFYRQMMLKDEKLSVKYGNYNDSYLLWLKMA